MKSPCRQPGCPNLVDKRGYCSVHKHKERQPDKDYDKRRRADANLGQSAAIRDSARWKRIRKLFLTMNPLCADPFGEHARRNLTETATQAHHVLPLATHPEHAFEFDNLMALCASCHARQERMAHSQAYDIATQHKPTSRESGPSWFIA